MAYDITVQGALLELDVVVTADDFQARGHSFLEPSADLATGKIKLFESGIYKLALNFTDIHEIDGEEPSDIEDAYDKIKALLANFNGGGAAPTLQTVTDNAAVTDNEITVKGIVVDDATAGARGIKGTQDFTANAQSLDFIQRKFIDDLIKYGSQEFVLDGIQTVFNIPHGMSSTPTSFAVTFEDAANLNFVQSTRTINATNIVFTCNDAPAIGNQTVYWQAYK